MHEIRREPTSRFVPPDDYLRFFVPEMPGERLRRRLCALSALDLCIIGPRVYQRSDPIGWVQQASRQMVVEPRRQSKEALLNFVK